VQLFYENYLKAQEILIKSYIQDLNLYHTPSQLALYSLYIASPSEVSIYIQKISPALYEKCKAFVVNETVVQKTKVGFWNYYRCWEIEKCGNILMNDNGFVDSDGDITPNSSVLD
jgi:hypothetical protein